MTRAEARPTSLPAGRDLFVLLLDAIVCEAHWS